MNKWGWLAFGGGIFLLFVLKPKKKAEASQSSGSKTWTSPEGVSYRCIKMQEGVDHGIPDRFEVDENGVTWLCFEQK